MTFLMNLYPGNQFVNLFVIITATVALVSSTAWIGSLFLGRHPAIRYRILFSALIAVLVSPLLAVVFSATGKSLVTVPLITDSRSSVAAIESRRNESFPVEHATPNLIGGELVASNGQPVTVEKTAAANEIAAPKIGEPTRIDSIAAEPEKRNEVPVVAALHKSDSIDIFQLIVVLSLLLWIVGASVSMIGVLRSSLFLRRLRRSMQESLNEELAIVFDEAKRLIHTRISSKLMVSSLVRTPLAMGLFRPVVVLPTELQSTISREQLCDVLVHELAHIERLDNWIVLLQTFARTLFWPIVSIHLLNRQLARAREEICDNYVLARRDAVSYGETLLQLAQLACGMKVPAGTVGILHWRGKLEDRIFGLIQAKRSKVIRTNLITSVAILASFLLIGSFLSSTSILFAGPDEQAKVVDAKNTEIPDKTPAKLPEIPADGKIDPKDAKYAGFFHGRVAGPDGKPLPNARVYIISAKSRSKDIGPVRTTTDAEGRFAFDAPDMTYKEYDGLPSRREGILVVKADGFAPDWFDTWGQATESQLREYWTPRKGDKFDMQLAKDDVPIHGRFLDPDGKPLVGARVRVKAMMVPRNRDLDAHIAHWSKASVSAHFLTKVPDYLRELFRPELIPGLTLETQTDADGRFKMSGIGRDRIVQLKVSAPNVIDTQLEVMTRDAVDVGMFLDGVGGKGKPTQTLHGAGFTLQLKRGLTIKGIVRDRDTKKPIPGMWVTKYSNPLTDSYTDLPVTDEEGRFTFSGLDPVLLTYEKAHHVIIAIPQPGVHYEMARATFERDSDVVIECKHGIPYRLKLVDELGKPVDADVEYHYVRPNPLVEDSNQQGATTSWPVMNKAAQRADGTYEGFVSPGPGAVVVKGKPGSRYRHAQVDPKRFFAPGKTDWTAQEDISAYGSLDTVMLSYASPSQTHYAAIVLVNPPKDSGPLELSANVVKEHPRQVSLIDSDGTPVSGAYMGFKVNGSADGFLLRTASFPLTGLHPDRVKRITFTKEDRKLIGVLNARGDGDTPYTVRMEKWGTVTGRIVDEEGRAYPISKATSDYTKPPIIEVKIDTNPPIDDHSYTDTDTKGRFRVGKLVPGQTYSGQVFQYGSSARKKLFEKLTLQPGEVRDLGDIRVKLNYEPSYIEPTEEDQKNTAKIPSEAWGEPVNGLRVAFALRSPFLYENEKIGYDIVAENVSDHDIRFAVPVHPRYGIYKLQIVGADGKHVPQHEGSLRNYADAPILKRFWLKPKQRMLISPCNTQLVKLDQAGEPTSSPERDPHFHSFNIKPGRYTLSATVKFGTTMQYNDEKSKIHKVEFGAKGEWTGELKTGAVAASLFEDASK